MAAYRAARGLFSPEKDYLQVVTATPWTELLIQIKEGQWKDRTPSERAYLTVKVMRGLGILKNHDSKSSLKWLEAKEASNEQPPVDSDA